MCVCKQGLLKVTKNKHLIFYLLWPRKGPLIKTQTQILDNRLYYTRKIELHRKGKKSRTVRITPILISVLSTVRRVHYRKIGKVPTTLFILLTGIRIWRLYLPLILNKNILIWHKTFSDSEARVLELCRVWRTHRLPLLQCPLWPGVVVWFMIPCRGQIILFENYQH